MSLRDDGVTEEDEMIVKDGPDGPVRLTLKRALTDDDGQRISGEEGLRRAQARIFSTKPEWYLYHLLLWEESIPDSWCLKGLAIVFPIAPFEDVDGKKYAICLEEDENHRLNKWVIAMHDISWGFGQNIRFLETDLLDESFDERGIGGESDAAIRHDDGLLGNSIGP